MRATLKSTQICALIATLFLCVGTLSAQPYLKSRAMSYIRKSATIIKESHKFLPDMDRQRLDGTFDRAVRHQRYARFLFDNQEYLNAIHHSDYARRLAFNVYHVENDIKPKSWEYTQTEKDALKNLPFNEELDRRLEERYPKIVFDDMPYLTDSVLYDLEFNDPKWK